MTRTHSKPVTLPAHGRQLAKIRKASERSGIPAQDIARLCVELGLATLATASRRTVEGVAK
jgi:hypothetical protein